MATETRAAGEGTWSPPEEFDEYRLLRPLGRGRTGMVFLAQDTLLDRPVAVKFVPALDSAALARFLTEARAAARVQHPNVVTLYRVGQLDNRPFLVSELVRGVGLDRLPKPVPWEKALELAIELARGLSAAHRRGVLHRDIKPGNVMVAESGEVKLLDFGLAKLVDHVPAASAPAAGGAPPVADRPAEAEISLPDLTHGSLFGTPHYMSPEAWRMEEASVRSDLYSLGCLLYELAAGRTPFRDLPASELPSAAQERDVPPLSTVAPSVDPRLAAAIERCLRRDRAQRFASADELLDALLEIRSAREVGPVPEGNPYRGLQAFEAEHRALFFGRRREIRAVCERLRTEPFVLVTGDSGAGKSSLAMAGVLPRIEEGTLEDGRRWSTARILPGRRPVAAVAATVGRFLSLDDDEAAELVRGDPETLARRLAQKVGRGGGLALYVDQLEELVTLGSPEETRSVGAALGWIALGVPGLRLLATVRSDFLTRMTAVPGLGIHVADAIYLLRPLGSQEIREAIVGPARVKGARFESDRLVETLVESTTAAQGSLPLLQFALAELWEARDRATAMITAEALEAIGGVAGALARHADSVMARLLPEPRTAAKRILMRLVTLEGTRARHRESELVGTAPGSKEALEALVRGRILVVREVDEGITYELAHEALVGGWASLARWLAEGAELREIQSRLLESAGRWDGSPRTRDLLWSPRQIAEADRLETDGLTEREHRFLAASRAKALRDLRLRRLLIAAIALALVLVYTGTRWRTHGERMREVDARLASAMAALEDARRKASTLEGKQKEAYRLFDVHELDRAEAAWREVLSATAALDAAYAHAGDAFEDTVAVDRGRKDVRSAFADYLDERARYEDRQRRGPIRDLLLQRLRQNDPEGVRLRAWEAPARLDLSVEPRGARVQLRRFRRDDGGRWSLEDPRTVDPVGEATVDAGAYRLDVEAEGYASLRAPLLLNRAERREVRLSLLPRASLPAGFVHVPAGRFLFGTAAEESVREYLKAVPIHEVETDGYLIAEHELTFGEWIDYLRTLGPAERARRTPRVAATGFHGAFSLTPLGGVDWRLVLRPSAERYTATLGKPIRYAKRDRRVEQDWRRFPVVGISFDDAAAYADWLDRTGRVPGARLCTELEWERAARGADAREFPHGDRLDPDDANIDVTYGKDPLGFGPDEVGSHRASESPFGLHDLSGNVWEWVRSSLVDGGRVARGGSYYFNTSAARVTNRELPEADFRDVTVGTRLCASLPK